MRSRIGRIQAKVLSSIIRWQDGVGYASRAHILHDVYGVPLLRSDRRSMGRFVRNVESMSVSRSVGTLVKRGFVEEVSSEVYRATLKGKEYAEAYSDIRGGGTRKTVQA